MIQARSSPPLYLNVQTMARQYVSRARFWMVSTFICLIVIVLLYSHQCFGLRRVVSQSVGQELPMDAGIEGKAPSRYMPGSSGNLSRSEARVFYGIMFDAGSTGSRIHVYQFSQESKDSPLRLMNETFEAIKPGLSSYKQHPDEAARSLVPLLDLAVAKIPPSKRPQTPVALKATAGLRLLPGNTADIILDKVENVMNEYPFKSNNDSVQIMDGTDEGIFSWMTVNFLLGSLAGRSKLVVALDLGGGSTQITFVPSRTETFADVPEDFQTNVKLFGRHYSLYTHSYLGLGLMSARFQIMGGSEQPKASPTSTTKVLSSPCLPPGFEGVFEHQGTKFPVKAVKEARQGYEGCYLDVRALVTSKTYRVDSVEELNSLPIYIFSYYYDRAVETGLIDGKEGGNITLSDFKKEARRICQHHLQKYPYMCMDLVYIYSLLHDGFGISKFKRLHLKKKIEGVEISWALGAMFDMLSPGNSSSSS